MGNFQLFFTINLRKSSFCFYKFEIMWYNNRKSFDLNGFADIARRIGDIMKAKKLLPLLALVMGLSAFGGCTNADQKVNFGNFWNENVLDTSATIDETLVYDVAFDASETSLVEYKLNYTDGKYTTNLTSATENGKTVYTYTTQLNITAHYTLNEETKSFNDSVTSTVKFLSGEYGFQPISSEKDINGTTPSATTPEKVDGCYRQFHYTVKTTYNDDCSEGTTTVTKLPLEGETGEAKSSDDTFEIEQKKYGYLDNEQVLLALRGVRNTTTSAKLLVYSPFSLAVQKVSYAFTAEASKEFSFYKNGSAELVKSTITYRPVTVVLDEKNPGATQTAWIEKPADTSKNTNRNVMLRLETPLSYGLGTLIYTLNSVSYQ